MRSFWSITLATLTKDIRLEWRSKDALNAMLFFSLLVVVIFVFSFDLWRKNRGTLSEAWFGWRFCLPPWLP